MYFQLDDIRFEGRYGISALAYREETRLPATPLINGKAALMRVGEELEQYNMAIRLHYSFINVPDAVERLRNLRRTAKVCTFVDGMGEILGDFIVKAVETTEMLRSHRGELLAAEMQLELIEYAPILANAVARDRAFDNAKALAENDITPVLLTALPASPAAEAVAALADARASAAFAAQAAELAVTVPVDQRPGVLNRIRLAAKDAVDRARAGLDALSRIQGGVANIPLLIGQSQDFVSRAAQLRDAAASGDVSGVNFASRDLLAQTRVVFDQTLPLNRLIMLRRL